MLFFNTRCSHFVFADLKYAVYIPACYQIQISFFILLAFFRSYGLNGQSEQRLLTGKDGLTMGYITHLFEDSKGYIWAGTYFGLNRFDGKELVSFTPNHHQFWSLRSNQINHITEDAFGLLWLSTENGVAVMEPVSERILQLGKYHSIFSDGNTIRGFVAPDNKIWFYQIDPHHVKLTGYISTRKLSVALKRGDVGDIDIPLDSIILPEWMNNGVSLFQPLDKESVLMANKNGRFLIINLLRKSVRETRLVDVSVALAGGNRFILNKMTGGGTLVSADYDFQNVHNAEFLQEIILNKDRKPVLFRFFNQEIKDASSILSGSVTPDNAKTILKVDHPSSMARLIDRNGRIWVGTLGYGLQYISKKPVLTDTLVSNLNIYNFSVLPDGHLWAGAYHPDVNINIKSKRSYPVEWKSKFSARTTVTNVLCDKNSSLCYLMVKNIDQQSLQLYAWNSISGQLKFLGVSLSRFTHVPPVMTLSHDKNIWITGSGGEIIKFHTLSGKWETFNISGSFPESVSEKLTARDINFDKSGNIWICYNHGLVRIWQENSTLKNEAFYNKSNDGSLFINDAIFMVEPDHLNKDLVWLGTLGGGLAGFNYKSKRIEYFQYDRGKKFNIVLSALRDKNQNLWLATDKGVSCFNTIKKQFLPYKFQRELNDEIFNATAKGVLPDGRLVFGGGKGLFGFYPEKLLEPNPTGHFYVSRIYINGQELNSYKSNDFAYIVNDQDVPFLEVPNTSNNLLFKVAAPMCADQELLMYRYRIEGITRGWSEMSSNGNISLTGIAPGAYTLEIIASGIDPESDHLVNTVLAFTVLPPWYLSRWAYLFYLILLALGVYGIILYDRKRLTLQHETVLARQEMGRLQSLDQFKNSFFAFIAHEFKSPLTIIMGLSEKLKNLVVKGRDSKLLIDDIQKESHHLLELIHEMIDITRIHDSTIEFNYTTQNFHEFMHMLVQSWQTLAEVNDIRLQSQIPQESLIINMDTLRYRHIFNNLISNAIRHTPTGGIIQIKVSAVYDSMVTVSIHNSGKGISKEKINQIFNKYYREESNISRYNFGLGLTLVKELVTLLHGKIEVDSDEKAGTTFTIHLPYVRSDEKEIHQLEIKTIKHDIVVSENDIVEDGADNPIVLLVDDDLSLLSYMKSVLEGGFNVVLAKNGVEGLNKALEIVPDIIVTDVLMPELDGLEMTNAIKSDQITNHIPVVMLSIKSDVEDRLAGQMRGADLYLAKPFMGQELLLAVQNLFSLQQKWKERYFNRNDETSDTDHEGAISENTIMTDEFMKSLYEVFDRHFASDTLDIKQICQEMHVSRSQLQRKLAVVTGLTPMELLYDFRLEKAKLLIDAQPGMTIKEIAFQTGFKQPPHFTRLFLQKFGLPPSEYKRKK